MTRMTKEHKDKLHKYIIDAICTDGYNVTAETEAEKLAFVYDCFLKEFGFNIPRLGERKAFAEWLGGLPSSFNIDYQNYEILKLAEELGQETKTETQQYKILNVWWEWVTHQTFKMMNKNGVAL